MGWTVEWPFSVSLPTLPRPRRRRRCTYAWLQTLTTTSNITGKVTRTTQHHVRCSLRWRHDEEEEDTLIVGATRITHISYDLRDRVGDVTKDELV